MTYQLLYYHSPNGNVGDDFNAWIFPKILPGLIIADSDTLLAGIGTILDNRIPKDKDVIIFGSGVRPGFSRPLITDRTHVRFVRGPLSAAECENHPRYIADPGILAARYWQPNSDADLIGVIPYFQSMHRLNWKRMAACIPNSTIIDSRQGVDAFFSALCKCRLILTESLHGAIFADAIGIPWQRFCALAPALESHAVSGFKWNDWSKSVELPETSIEPNDSTLSLDILGSKFRRIKNELALGRRLRLASRSTFYLSSESLRMSRLSELDEQIEWLKTFAGVPIKNGSIR